MPLTEKGREIKSKMTEEYGPEKGECVFYASRNAGTITGVDATINAVRGGRRAADDATEHLGDHRRMCGE